MHRKPTCVGCWRLCNRCRCDAGVCTCPMTQRPRPSPPTLSQRVGAECVRPPACGRGQLESAANYARGRILPTPLHVARAAWARGGTRGVVTDKAGNRCWQPESVPQAPPAPFAFHAVTTPARQAGHQDQEGRGGAVGPACRFAKANSNQNEDLSHLTLTATAGLLPAPLLAALPTAAPLAVTSSSSESKSEKNLPSSRPNHLGARRSC